MLSEKRSQSHFYLLLEYFRHNLRKKLLTAYKKTKSSDLSLLASFDALSIWHSSSLNSFPHPRSPTAHDLIRGLFRQIWLQFSPKSLLKNEPPVSYFRRFFVFKITLTNTFGRRAVPISLTQNITKKIKKSRRSRSSSRSSSPVVSSCASTFFLHFQQNNPLTSNVRNWLQYSIIQGLFWLDKISDFLYSRKVRGLRSLCSLGLRFYYFSG
ncbi:hypothetical protein C1646_501459 [Rhizophagus diaphanus]|nr:hypothetical protein C1646_501459 [Rhizophagus diaphanus] [Rhizophagus sp. MUCL 43196]